MKKCYNFPTWEEKKDVMISLDEDFIIAPLKNLSSVFFNICNDEEQSAHGQYINQSTPFDPIFQKYPLLLELQKKLGFDVYGEYVVLKSYKEGGAGDVHVDWKAYISDDYEEKDRYFIKTVYHTYIGDRDSEFVSYNYSESNKCSYREFYEDKKKRRFFYKLKNIETDILELRYDITSYDENDSKKVLKDFPYRYTLGNKYYISSGRHFTHPQNRVYQEFVCLMNRDPEQLKRFEELYPEYAYRADFKCNIIEELSKYYRGEENKFEEFRKVLKI